MKILGNFFSMPETIFLWGTWYNSVTAYGFDNEFCDRLMTNFHSNVCYCFLTNLMSRIPGFF